MVLADEYTPIFNIRDIINLGVREFYLKMSINGELSEAFSGKTLDMNFPKEDISKEIVEESRRAYCTPRADVEEMLKKWDEGALDEPGSANAAKNTVIEEETEFEMPLI